MRWTHATRIAAVLILALPGCAKDRAAPGFPDPELADAYGVLRQTEIFASTCVGFAGSMPAAVPAWREIADHPRAAEHFRALLGSAPCAGQLYALAGLYFVDRRAFDEEVPSFLQRTDSVNVMAGCILGAEEVRHVTEDIRFGGIPGRLLGMDCPR